MVPAAHLLSLLLPPTVPRPPDALGLAVAGVPDSGSRAASVLCKLKPCTSASLRDHVATTHSSRNESETLAETGGTAYEISPRLSAHCCRIGGPWGKKKSPRNWSASILSSSIELCEASHYFKNIYRSEDNAMVCFIKTKPGRANPLAAASKHPPPPADVCTPRPSLPGAAAASRLPRPLPALTQGAETSLSGPFPHPLVSRQQAPPTAAFRYPRITCCSLVS